MGMIKKVNHKVVMLKNSNAWMLGCPDGYVCILYIEYKL